MKSYKLVPKSAIVEERQDASTERAMKIQRYKDMKQAKSALFALQALAIQKKRKGIIGDSEDDSYQDEENERKIWLKQISVAALQAVEQEGHLIKVQILKHRLNFSWFYYSLDGSGNKPTLSEISRIYDNADLLHCRAHQNKTCSSVSRQDIRVSDDSAVDGKSKKLIILTRPS